MDTLAGSLEHRPHESGRRSLPIGTGDVNDRRQALIGMAERCHEGLDSIQREVDLTRMKVKQSLENGA
jgi:hypothetical protein